MTRIRWEVKAMAVLGMTETLAQKVPKILKTMATTKGSNKVTSRQMAAIAAAKAHAALFKYTSSKADERFFKIEIQAWLQTHPDQRKTWTQLMMDMVWERNNGGTTLKYGYFNDHHQRFYLYHTFTEWATRTRGQIFNALKQQHAKRT